MSWLARVLVFGVVVCGALSGCAGDDSAVAESVDPDSPTTVPSGDSATSESSTSESTDPESTDPESTEPGSTQPDETDDDPGPPSVELVSRSDASGVVAASVPEDWQVTGDGPNNAGGISWQLRSDPGEPGPSLWAFAGGLGQSRSDEIGFAEFATSVNICDTEAKVESTLTVGTTAATRYDYPSCRDDRQGTILLVGDGPNLIALIAVITDIADGVHEDIVSSIQVSTDGQLLETDESEDGTSAPAGLTRVVDDSGRLIIELPDDWSYDTKAASGGQPFIGATKSEPARSLLEAPLLQFGISDTGDSLGPQDTADLRDELLDQFGVMVLDCESFAPTPWSADGTVGHRVNAKSCGQQRLDVSAFVGTILGSNDIVFLIVSTENGAAWNAMTALESFAVS